MAQFYPYHRRAWLWWLALLILVVGGVVSYSFYLRSWTPEARMGMSLSILLSVLGAGICVICATADWWLHR